MRLVSGSSVSTLTSTESPPTGAAASSQTLAATLNRATARSRAHQREVLLDLLEAIVGADTWDEQVYHLRPVDDWVLIHRSSWGAIRDIAETIDSWRPWSGESRPTAP